MARSQLFGTAVSPGIAIGKIVRTHQEAHVEERFITPEDIDVEVEKLRAATKHVHEDLRISQQNMREEMAELSSIIQTHIMISKDPRLLDDAEEFVRTQRLCAPWALQKAIDALSAAFLDIDDPYLQERALDLRAVGLRLQCRLAGKEYVPMVGESPRVHMAEDLSPVDTLDLPADRILALVMSEGGVTSHTAILARSLRIPAVVGVTGLLEIAKEGDLVIVDALQGCVLIAPDDAELEVYHQKRAEYIAWVESVRQSGHLAAETRDAVRVEVQANLERASEVDNIAHHGAEGIGLYRTEFAYLRGRKLPTEEQLYKEYSEVVQKAAPHRVIFRVLDVGADKMLDTQTSLKEANPALGLRGIRFCLRHQGLLRTQFRALYRAALHGPMAIMLPMISCMEEVHSVKHILQEVRQDLKAQGIAHAQRLPLGIMIEVPSAVLIADALARECDFFSIGTNDLVHYLLGIDRGNKHVAYLHQPLHPAVTRSLKRVIDCAHREGISVAVCGEMVTDPYCLAVLLGMGVDTVSATPQYIPAIKHLVRSLHAEQCQQMSQMVLRTSDTAACMRIVKECLAQSLVDDYSFYSTIFPSQ